MMHRTDQPDTPVYRQWLGVGVCPLLIMVVLFFALELPAANVESPAGASFGALLKQVEEARPGPASTPDKPAETAVSAKQGNVSHESAKIHGVEAVSSKPGRSVETGESSASNPRQSLKAPDARPEQVRPIEPESLVTDDHEGKSAATNTLDRALA